MTEEATTQYKASGLLLSQTKKLGSVFDETISYIVNEPSLNLYLTSTSVEQKVPILSKLDKDLKQNTKKIRSSIMDAEFSIDSTTNMLGIQEIDNLQSLIDETNQFLKPLSTLSRGKRKEIRTKILQYASGLNKGKQENETQDKQEKIKNSKPLTQATSGPILESSDSDEESDLEETSDFENSSEFED
ncbi:mef2b protein [Anaeramoeba flamelloides]|uniref:Mef2b protein n=1 Tax=Anaeramoeba flamelloides TaxID=1746091 RepID=A0AAV8A3S3_9EUKA|nr:mef2b protein [Anaeramoeba flamelloides]